MKTNSMSTQAQGSPTELKYGQLPTDAEQDALVKKMSERIAAFSYYMKRSFDQGQVDEALKHATNMLEELRTNLLSPINYNVLYQQTLSELLLLSTYFQDESLFPKRRIAELYEVLQYTPNIVPRLYLLFTLAPAFIKAGHAKANDVMRDLIEMARGVQHPTRALFLRHYLLQCLKDVLPDGKSEGGTIEDTLTFILENFKQMNVLWVRLEFSLNQQTVEERKQQRSQLKQLVGSNIQRISALRDLDVAHYKEIVLPYLVEQIKACREPLAQYYIIESITQVFPVEFHIETLDVVFGVLQCLEDDVSTLQLVTALIDRLKTYETTDENAINTVRLVAVQIYSLLHAGQSFALEDTLDMLSSLLNFTLKADARNFDNVNAILRLVENHIEGIYGDSRLDSVGVSRKLRYFLVTPLREMADASMLFELEYFPVLVNRMRFLDRKLIALEVCRSFARTESPIGDPDSLRSFFAIVQVLLKRPQDYEDDPDNLPASASLSAVGRVFHLIRVRGSLDDTFALISSVSTTIQNLDAEVKECLYLPLGEELLRIAVEIDADPDSCETTVRAVLQHIYILLTEGDPPAIPSFWLFVEAALISDRCATEGITTEFFTSAFRIWKEGMIDGTVRFRMLVAMVRAATQLRKISADMYESITSELCNAAGKLLQKDQQVEAYLLCAHMYNIDREAAADEEEEEDEEDSVFKNPSRIKGCLVRALKATSTMMDAREQLPWYYKVLSSAIYFIEKGIDLPEQWFNALRSQIDTLHDNLGGDLESKISEQNRRFYQNTIRHMRQVISSK